MDGENEKAGYNPEYDALPEPEGGYTREYIEKAIENGKKEIADFEVKINDLMVGKGKFPEVEKTLEDEIEKFKRGIILRQTIIEIGKKKIEELFPEEEIKSGKYE